MRFGRGERRLQFQLKQFNCEVGWYVTDIHRANIFILGLPKTINFLKINCYSHCSKQYGGYKKNKNKNKKKNPKNKK